MATLRHGAQESGEGGDGKNPRFYPGGSRGAATFQLGFIESGRLHGRDTEGVEALSVHDGYFYFSSQIKIPVLHVGEPVFKKPATLEEIREVRNQLIEGMVAQDRKGVYGCGRPFSASGVPDFGGKKGRRLLPLRKHDSYHRGSFGPWALMECPWSFKDILEQARQKASPMNALRPV